MARAAATPPPGSTARSGPPASTRNASAASTLRLLFGDRDLAGDVRATVVPVLEAVAQVELADGNRHRGGELERGRQPDVRERLAHRHRRVQIVDVQQPLRRQEVEADVVE